MSVKTAMLPLFAVCLLLTGGIVVFTKLASDVPHARAPVIQARPAGTWNRGNRDVVGPHAAGTSPGRVATPNHVRGGDRAPAEDSARQAAAATKTSSAPEYFPTARSPPRPEGGSPYLSANPAIDINLPLAFQIPESHLPNLAPADAIAIEAVQEQFAEAMEEAPTQDPTTPEYSSYWNHERLNANDRLRQRLGHEGYNRFNSWVAQLAEQQKRIGEFR